MENDRDRLVVIIAGYRADLKFLDTNRDFGARFTRNIDFPSLRPMSRTVTNSVFEQSALQNLERCSPVGGGVDTDTNGISRRSSLDIAKT